jgi:hypothetical protein
MGGHNLQEVILGWRQMHRLLIDADKTSGQVDLQLAEAAVLVSAAEELVSDVAELSPGEVAATPVPDIPFLQ